MDRLYLYPQTSCPCLDCKKNEPLPIEKGFKSNLAVRGCNIPAYFNCHSRLGFGIDTQPKCDFPPSDKCMDNNDRKSRERACDSIYTVLNPRVMTDKYSPYFHSEVDCGNNSSCGGKTFVSSDPRLFDAARSQYLTLDRPPIESTVKLRDVYDKKLTGYGKNYRNYDDIKEGQITYYTDKSISSALFEPVFGEKAIVNKDVFKDPMGSLKPEYIREAVLNTENPVTNDRGPYPYNLSFIQDTQSHREDIMSKQMAKMNQSKWSARWD